MQISSFSFNSKREKDGGLAVMAAPRALEKSPTLRSSSPAKKVQDMPQLHRQCQQCQHPPKSSTTLPPQPLRSPDAKLFRTRSPPSHRESHLIHQSVPHLAHRVDVHSPRPSSIRASQSHPPARLVITQTSATRSTVQCPMSTSKPPLKALRCASHRSNNGKSRVSFIPRNPLQDLCSAQAQAKPTHRRRTDHLAAARGIRALRGQSADDAAANHSFVERKKISSSVLPPLLLPALQAACSIRPLFASIPSLRPSSMRHRKRPVNQRQLAWWMRACATHGVL